MLDILSLLFGALGVLRTTVLFLLIDIILNCSLLRTVHPSLPLFKFGFALPFLAVLYSSNFMSSNFNSKHLNIERRRLRAVEYVDAIVIR